MTLPKLRLAGFGLNVPVDTPIPDNVIVSEGFGASEVMVTVPLAFPLAFGAKLTVKVVLCDALSDTGVVIPVMENALLLTES